VVAIAITVLVPRLLLRYFSKAETEKILIFSSFDVANIFLSLVINPAARSAGISRASIGILLRLMTSRRHRTESLDDISLNA
jgi:hypothetical protein